MTGLKMMSITVLPVSGKYLARPCQACRSPWPICAPLTSPSFLLAINLALDIDLQLILPLTCTVQFDLPDPLIWPGSDVWALVAVVPGQALVLLCEAVPDLLSHHYHVRRPDQQQQKLAQPSQSSD
jgi:hypothetical protein